MAGAEIVDPSTAKSPWLVLVHGMSQDRRVFDRQVDTFRMRYRILLVDLPGHGLAGDAPGPYGHVEMAGAVSETLACHGVADAVYWGTHTGATLGLYLAGQQPDRFRTLVLEGPLVPGQNAPVVVQAVEKVRRTAAAEGFPAALEEWLQESSWFEEMRTRPEACRRDAHFAIVRDFRGKPLTDARPGAQIADIESRIRRIQAPALIYNGERDHPDFLAAADAIAALLPNVDAVRIPDAGGFPAWEAPNAVNRRVTAFLDERTR